MSFFNRLILDSGLMVRVQCEHYADGSIGVRYFAYRNPTPAEVRESEDVMAAIMARHGSVVMYRPGVDETK